MRTTHWLSVFILAFFLAGCGSAPPVPEDHFYIINPSAKIMDKPVAGLIVVRRFQTSSLYNERNIVMHHAGLEHERTTYHYHYWMDEPSRMLQHYLTQSIRNQHADNTVIASEYEANARYQIDGVIQTFDHINSSGKNSAEVVLTIKVRDMQNGQTLHINTHKASAQSKSKHLSDVALAFQQAIDEIFAQVYRDLASLN